MISMLICSGEEKELRCIHLATVELAAHLSDEKWEVENFSSTADVIEFISGQPIIDLICLDITLEDSIPLAEELRRISKSSFIVLIADTTISPMQYMKPSIRAASLLLRPITKIQVKENLEEVFVTFLRETDHELVEDMFVIENKEGKIRIPYDRILYFEAREKKIYIRTDSKEIAFYETMEYLVDRLPEYFFRCHRSYIVNGKKIRGIKMSQNSIQLEDDIMLPVSRSYKSIAKEYVEWN